MFKKYEPINLEIYDEYYAYLELKKKLNIGITKNELNSLVSRYGYKIERLEGLFDDLEQEQFRGKMYSELRNKYLSSINYVLRDSILLMKKNDQLYRGTQFGDNIEKQRKIDSFNSLRLKEIFENYGYPDKDLIGNTFLEIYSNDSVTRKIYSLDILTILLHTSKDEREKYFLPKLKEFVVSGETNPLIYGYVYDQALLYDLKDQYYGTYENKIDEVFINKINKNRKIIGLPSYGYERWRRIKKHPETFKN